MKWYETNCAMKCTDRFGSLVVFEKTNYDKHKRYHPELRQSAFCPDRIVEALKRPTLTIRGNTPHSLCYYLEEFSKGDIMLYTKVVVHEQHRNRSTNPICKIKTAFRTSVIKETDYGFEATYY